MKRKTINSYFILFWLIIGIWNIGLGVIVTLVLQSYIWALIHILAGVLCLIVMEAVRRGKLQLKQEKEKHLHESDQ
ncbi:hypothetical protein CHL76_02730 [Marinococcus halophilus]|uniref:Uncharacterized protein n=1 Tax=Marinococcus halophilus TaxID=1371 RepID=A0A510Y214_MARHA|nr:hypothetical protein [Marinococcus halophilus]OZT81290.1 hypothetical protein CHL76_02730 [Marinococcus halophilus]GEK57233.1 hypothetical protein MHA01_01380 [Marinococcus halophilus]